MNEQRKKTGINYWLGGPLVIAFFVGWAWEAVQRSRFDEELEALIVGHDMNAQVCVWPGSHSHHIGPIKESILATGSATAFVVTVLAIVRLANLCTVRRSPPDPP